jgi:hypothetical protein
LIRRFDDVAKGRFGEDACAAADDEMKPQAEGRLDDDEGLRRRAARPYAA